MQIIKLKSLPTPLTLMMLAIIIAALSTWLLPAGQYNKLSASGSEAFVMTSNAQTTTLPFLQHTLDSLSINIPLEKFKRGEIRKPVSVPGTYHKLESRHQGTIEVLQAPIKGIMDSIDIALFVLFIGGFMSVFTKTGAMFRGVSSLAQNMQGRERLLMVVLIFIFSFLGGSYGMDVESIVFYPVLVPLFLAAGYDLMIPLAIVFGGAAVGFSASFTNPFNVIIASNTAGINWIDGLYERLAFFLLSTSLYSWYVLRYAARIKKDPSRSIVLQTDGIEKSSFNTSESVTGDGHAALSVKTKILLLIFLLTFSGMIIGIVFFDWWTTEMSALFFGAAILVAIIERMQEKTFVKEFVAGMENLLAVALIIGLARGVTVILNDGLVADSILYYASNIVQHFSPAVFIILVMIFYFFFVVLVSSSSGMAVLTMPIIGALAIIMNIPGREIVNAYTWGIGAMFLISPTGSVFPALLMVQVSYKAWLKFITGFLILILVIIALFLIIGINYS